MSAADDEKDLQNLFYDVNQRQFYRRPPQRMGSDVNKLLARKGYAYEQTASDFQQAWATAAGARHAPHTRAGAIKRNVLEIIVRNSAVLQELKFEERQILKKLQALLPDHKLKSLKFRVGELE